MNKIKNWLLAALIIAAGVLDLGFGLLNDFAVELSINPKIVGYVRIAVIVAGAIILKLQPPSNNPEKLQGLVQKARAKRAELKK